MTRAALLAAGLLSLTLATACSQDEVRRTTAEPATSAGTSSPTASASAPAVQTEVTVEPSAAAAAPSAIETREEAATSPAAAPRAAAPAPAPRATNKPGSASSPEPAPRPSATSTPATSPPTTPAPSSQFALTIEDFAFTPRVLTIPVGSTVTATNRDGATHDWTSRNSVWRSGDLQQGESYSFTFPTSGTFDYLCERHPQMTGSITVTPN